jgi:ATP-dependent Clp protease ATP-binding subunit ClpB
MDSALESAVQLSAKFIPDRQLPDKAIDLMDEALSSVKMKSISKPMEVEKLEKLLRTHEIELEAKKHEEVSPEKLLQLEDKIRSIQSEVHTLSVAWKKEKDLITEIKHIREQSDKLKIEADNYERAGNL